MASKEQMAAVAAQLMSHTSSLDKPVTEIAVFKLREPRTEATTSEFESQIIGNARGGAGIQRMAWGYSKDDPYTLVWMLDWFKIQDHFDFWQTDSFPPLVAAIFRLFVDGRPLVRHYNFQPAGMIDQEHIRILVWDDEASDKTEEQLRGTVATSGKWTSAKSAYAVDLGEMSWCCTLLGYESEEAARADKVTDKGESHIVQLKFFNDL